MEGRVTPGGARPRPALGRKGKVGRRRSGLTLPIRSPHPRPACVCVCVCVWTPRANQPGHSAPSQHPRRQARVHTPFPPGAHSRPPTLVAALIRARPTLFFFLQGAPARNPPTPRSLPVGPSSACLALSPCTPTSRARRLVSERGRGERRGGRGGRASAGAAAHTPRTHTPCLVWRRRARPLAVRPECAHQGPTGTHAHARCLGCR